MAQELFLGGNRLALGGGDLRGLAGGGEASPRLAHSGNGTLVACVVVQNGTVAARVQQAAVVMLAMQLNQRFREAAQDLSRAATVIDPSGFAAICGVDTAQDELIASRQPCVFEHGMSRVTGRQIKPGGDFPLIGPLPHQIGTPAPAQHKTQGIQQDRLARPGLAGQHV